MSQIPTNSEKKVLPGDDSKIESAKKALQPRLPRLLKSVLWFMEIIRKKGASNEDIDIILQMITGFNGTREIYLVFSELDSVLEITDIAKIVLMYYIADWYQVLIAYLKAPRLVYKTVPDLSLFTRELFIEQSPFTAEHKLSSKLGKDATMRVDFPCISATYKRLEFEQVISPPSMILKEVETKDLGRYLSLRSTPIMSVFYRKKRSPSLAVDNDGNKDVLLWVVTTTGEAYFVNKKDIINSDKLDTIPTGTVVTPYPHNRRNSDWCNLYKGFNLW